jgi:hypothetical protein
MTRAAWLVMGLADPSRGDDALGPLLIERLRASGVEEAGDVELCTEFGLQTEHVLDLEDRRGDASTPACRRRWMGCTRAARLHRKASAFQPAASGTCCAPMLARHSRRAQPSRGPAPEGVRTEIVVSRGD